MNLLWGNDDDDVVDDDDDEKEAGVVVVEDDWCLSGEAILVDDVNNDETLVSLVVDVCSDAVADDDCDAAMMVTWKVVGWMVTPCLIKACKISL